MNIDKISKMTNRNEFEIKADHNSLNQYLNQAKFVNPRLMCWLMVL